MIKSDFFFRSIWDACFAVACSVTSVPKRLGIEWPRRRPLCAEIVHWPLTKLVIPKWNQIAQNRLYPGWNCELTTGFRGYIQMHLFNVSSLLSIFSYRIICSDLEVSDHRTFSVHFWIAPIVAPSTYLIRLKMDDPDVPKLIDFLFQGAHWCSRTKGDLIYQECPGDDATKKMLIRHPLNLVSAFTYTHITT